MQSLVKTENHGRASALNGYFHSFTHLRNTLLLPAVMSAGIVVKVLHDVLIAWC
jgi:hypothetical protein